MIPIKKCRICGKLPEGPSICGHQIYPVKETIYTVSHYCHPEKGVRINITAYGDTEDKAIANWNRSIVDEV